MVEHIAADGLELSANLFMPVVRLTDVAPNGVSSQVSIGILNLTHRHGHADLQPLTPGEVNEIPHTLKPPTIVFGPVTASASA